MKDIIPEPLLKIISEHLILHSRSVIRIWEASSDEEDSITGHFCGLLQTNWSRHTQYGNQGNWRWRISYKKFRSKGPNAFENIVGADGLVQIEIEQKGLAKIETKSILFQAKKHKLGYDPNLSDQVEKMELLGESASAIFIYSREGFQAIASSQYIKRNESDSNSIYPLQSIGTFLGKDFMECRVGLRGMYYDGLRKILNVPESNGSVKQYRVDVGHRLSVDLQKED